MFHVKHELVGDSFDVIVVGGGHAGCEAASVAARRGCKTLMIAIDLEGVGAMSCNPAIGGVGKGHIVREIDVFGGIIGSAADDAAIHYRMLNRSKGVAVHGPRAQADRNLYRASVRARLDRLSPLRIIAGEVVELWLSPKRVGGVVLASGERISSRGVILATGTFLGGRLFRGEERMAGGRLGERDSSRLAAQLRAMGLVTGRLKTGTPPRLCGRSIDWSRLDRQPSDGGSWTMAPFGNRRSGPMLFCGIARTNAAAHDVVRRAFDRSPLLSGEIAGRGPRYCPSIEDKVIRFGDRDGHQVFLEPETQDGSLIYPNGLSTSLPADVQERMVRQISGLERSKIVTPGYAVEYDHIDPRSLTSALSVGGIEGLFLAGQINGTTGYEEAAGQGLVAGLNASACALDKPPIHFARETSYIGVMIDDLTRQGITEPYRMLTARAEHRLSLRADNAESRLAALALASGCLDAPAEAALNERQSRRERLSVLADLGVGNASVAETDRIAEEIEADRYYAPYVRRQKAELAKARLADMPIRHDFDFAAVKGLSSEMIERLAVARPSTLSQASRVRGVTAAAMTALAIAARRPGR